MKQILCLSLLFLSCSKDRTGKPIAIITTAQGEIKVEFFQREAPKHVANFIKLAEDGFYNGTTFHRTEPSLIQGGDPNSKDKTLDNDGFGQMEYTIPSEFHFRHFRGALAMAKKPLAYNANNESSGCQFYFALDSLKYLDEERYTIFGKVIDGLDVLDSISRLEYHQGTNPNTPWKKVTEMSVEIDYLQFNK